jgi:flagellar biosynthesis GTPase FlhF
MSATNLEQPPAETNGHASDPSGLRTYRGKTLDEILPRIRAELGPDAIVVRQRDGLMGGVGGFFQQQFVEVEARVGASRRRLDLYDEAPQAALPTAPAVPEAELPGAELPVAPRNGGAAYPPLPGGAGARVPAVPAPAAPLLSPRTPAEILREHSEQFARQLAAAEARAAAESSESFEPSAPSAPVARYAPPVPDVEIVEPAEPPAAPDAATDEVPAPEPVVAAPVVAAPVAPAPVAAAPKRAPAPRGAKPAKRAATGPKPKPKPAPKATSKANDAVTTAVAAPAPAPKAAREPATGTAEETAPSVATAPKPAAPEPAAAKPAAPEPAAPEAAAAKAAAPKAAAPKPATPKPATPKPAARRARPAAAPSTPRGARRGVFGTRRKGRQPQRPPVVDPVASGAVATALVGRGLSAPVAAALLADVTEHVLPFTDGADLRAAARTALARRILVSAPPPVGGRSVAFVGSAGSGKTRCAAGLAAAYAAASALPVVCLTLASLDRGAELATLLEAHGVEVEPHATSESAAKRIEALRGEALVVLDTPGVSPGDAGAIAELAALLSSLALDETQLVIPATLSAVAVQELVERLAPLRPNGVAMTHADATGHVGAVVELACATRLPLAYVNEGLALPGALRPADPILIAERMLP